MITNRYFILPLPHSPNSSLWNLTVQTFDTARKNNLNTKIVVKLYEGDEENHPILNGIQEYTHAQILVELAKAEWQIENPF